MANEGKVKFINFLSRKYGLTIEDYLKLSDELRDPIDVSFYLFIRYGKEV